MGWLGLNFVFVLIFNNRHIITNDYTQMTQLHQQRTKKRKKKFQREYCNFRLILIYNKSRTANLIIIIPRFKTFSLFVCKITCFFFQVICCFLCFSKFPFFYQSIQQLSTMSGTGAKINIFPTRM